MSTEECHGDVLGSWFSPVPEMRFVSRSEMSEVLERGSASAVVERLRSIESANERDRAIIEIVTDIGSATHELCTTIDALADFQDPRAEKLIRTVIANIERLTILQDAVLDMFENSEPLPELSPDDVG